MVEASTLNESLTRESETRDREVELLKKIRGQQELDIKKLQEQVFLGQFTSLLSSVRRDRICRA